MKILALDTATEACSAALWIDGEILLREAEFERGHAERILTMVDELLAQAELKLGRLDAIAFGRGPGSFTGVRMAASVTQGLAFGAGLSVVGVSDLRAVAQRVVGANYAATRVVVCNDARMHEVYWACFERAASGLMEPVSQERVSKPADVHLPTPWLVRGVGESRFAHGAGRGFSAYAELRAKLSDDLVDVDDRVLPRATEIATLAAPEVVAGHALAPEEAVPVYLRDDVARPNA